MTVSYRIRQVEPVAQAVPRIARKQAGKAVRSLASRRSAIERVHDARTSVKKLRALLRLVQSKPSPREDKRLRKLGGTLSRLRDAQVLVQTFDSLFGHFAEQLGPPLRRVRTHLEHHRRTVEAKMDLAGRLHDASDAFRKTRKRAQHWVRKRDSKSGDGWKAIVGGLGATYRWGRRAMETAYRTGEDGAFHDWRKAVKYHGYHMRLLADLWPQEMTGRQGALDELGSLLGEDHDLVMFAETLRTEPRCFDDERDREVLLGLVEQRKAALRAMARPLGRRLFAERPREFRLRLHGYWRAWRAGDPPAMAAPVRAAA